MITFTARQAAPLLERSQQTVTQMCRDGRLPNAFKNYSWHIPLDDIVAYKEQRPAEYAGCPRCGIITGGVVCDDCRRERAGGGYRWYECPTVTSTWGEGSVRL